MNLEQNNNHVESKICKYCNKLQEFNQFGTYQIKGRSYKNYRLKCNTCRRTEEAERYKKFPEIQIKMKERSKIYSLNKSYGLTLEDVQHRKVQQNFRCAICKHEKNLCVDHDHKSGRNRGMLCKSCNFGIGYFHDNVDNLIHAIEYLKEYKK